MYAAKLARFTAKLIDLFLAMLISFFLYPLGVILAVLYLSLADALPKGQSIGKRIIGFSVIDVETGDYCSKRQSVIRNLPVFLPLMFLIFPFWGWFMAFLLAIPLFLLEGYLLWTNDKERHLGDVMAETTVVPLPKDKGPLRASVSC
jgi:uncharacterized RDD family membrane protein YckC